MSDYPTVTIPTVDIWRCEPLMGWTMQAFRCGLEEPSQGVEA